MWRKILLIPLFFLPMILWGQPYYSISCDSQDPTEQFVIDAMYSGNTPFLRSYHYDSGVPIDLTSWSMSFLYSYGQFDTNGMVEIPGIVSATNLVTYTGGTNIFFQSFDRYYFSIRGISTEGYVKTFATGKMIQRYDPAAATNIPTLMGQLNVDWWSNNVGLAVSSNTANITILTTGKVDCTAFSGTNLIFEGRIAVNEAFNVAQALTNTAIDVRLSAEEAATTNQASTNTNFGVRIASNETFRITTQPATNLVIQNQVTANYTNQNATNTSLQDQIDVVGTGTWSLALLSDGSRPANYLDVVNTNYLGANIVTNGTFTGSASNWSLTTFFYSGNRVVLNPSLTGSIEYTNTLVVTSKKLYQLTVGTTYAGAAVTASVGGVTSTWTSVDGATQTEYFFADNDSKIVISAGTGTNSLELDNITLKECPTGSIFVAQDVNAGNSVKARVGVYAPNITAISNNADIIKGGTFSGPITNLYGYYGDGGGLTNITATTTNVPVHDQDWSTITGTPTSLSGYGITNSTGDSMTRYFANTNAGQVVEVFATGTGITASRTNEKFYVSIPSGIRMVSMRMRVDGDYTASGVIYLQMGTNDMDNSGFATMWVPSVNCIRESDYANVVLTCKPDSVDDTLIKIAGLGTTAGIIYALHLVF